MSSSPQPSPTQDDQRSGLPLRRLLVGLTLLTVAAAVEKVVGLSAPMPSVEAPTRLSLDGYRISALQDSAPRHGRGQPPTRRRGAQGLRDIAHGERAHAP